MSMTKYYAPLLVSLSVLAGTAAAQKTQQPRNVRDVKPSLDATQPVGPALGASRVTLWEDDFSDPSVWTVGHDGNLELDWQIGVGLTNSGSYPTAPVNSPTAGNGYAMLDSDGFNNNTGVPEASHMTAGPFSTDGYPNVVLEFQTFYRKWTNEECYIVVSTNNTDWVPLTPQSTDGGPLPNVYEVFPGMAVQAVIQNPTRVRINISQYAGNQPQVWVRFYWAGEYGYSWFVDDVKVIEQPAYELIMEDGYLSHTGEGEEYGRIPVQHLNPTMQVGGNFNNFGVNTMTNLQVSMEVSGPNPFSAQSTPVDLNTAEAGLMDQSVALPNGGALGDGIYNASFTLSSNENSSEEDLTNNVYLRNFEVNPLWYTLDGIGNHPSGYQALGSVGSNSFNDAADGLIVMNYYPLAVQETVYGMEFLITSASQAGSYVICGIYDTTLVNSNLGSPIYETDVIDITQANVDDGRVVVRFAAPQTLNPGGYFLAIKLFSNGGTTHIRIVDDLTVPQPGLASAIQIPADQVYSNGNAYAIRLSMDANISVGNDLELEGVSLYPNPTNGIVNIHTNTMDNYSIEVLNAVGGVVRQVRTNGSTKLDLSTEAKGVYTVRISSPKGSSVRRIALN
jgi:hypothetical protein